MAHPITASVASPALGPFLITARTGGDLKPPVL